MNRRTCLIVTDGIRSLAEKIRSKFSNLLDLSDDRISQMVGLYNGDNNLSPDYIPTPSQLVNFMENKYLKDDKSLFDVLQMATDPIERVEVRYTPTGKSEQVYIVDGVHIYNKDGKEVFTKDAANAGKDRMLIYALARVQQGKAVRVSYKGKTYIVNSNYDIVSEASGNKMQWDEKNGDRKLIVMAARQMFKKIQNPDSNQQSQPEVYELTREQIQDINRQFIDNLKWNVGVPVHGKSEFEAYLKNHGKIAQEATEEKREMDAIKEQALKDGTFMKAPNGKPTNLTERQWLQVRTKAFKAWFGDWENAYKWTYRLYNIDKAFLEDSERDKLIEDFNNGKDVVIYAGSNDIQQLLNGIDFRKTGVGLNRRDGVFYASYSLGYAQDYANLYALREDDLNSIGVAKIVINKQNIEGGITFDKSEIRIADSNLIKSIEDVTGTKNLEKVRIPNRKSKDVSKVVDENGEPLVVYHGTRKDFNVFNTKDTKASYFTTDRQYAGNFAVGTLEDTVFDQAKPRILGVFLNIKNPTYLNDINRKTVKETIDSQENEKSIDGIIGHDSKQENLDPWDDFTNSEGTEFVIFSPNQVKSATDNNGDFSRENNDIQAYIGKKARTQFENELRNARPDMSDAEIKATLDFLHSLEDNKENTAYIRTAITWIANRSITLPQDNTKARQAFDLARKKRVDIQKYKTLGELILAPEMQPKEKEKPAFSPDEAKTFSNKRTVTTESGRVFTVYDVENTEEGQREVCKALAAHYPTSPWCLSTFTATGEPTQSAKHYWNYYDALPRKIAYENGRPVAFNSDTNKDSYLPTVMGTINNAQFLRITYSDSFLYNGGELSEEEKDELVEKGYAEKVDDSREMILTEKGLRAASYDNNFYNKIPELKTGDSWWDMNDESPQETLSDNIVSDTKKMGSILEAQTHVNERDLIDAFEIPDIEEDTRNASIYALRDVIEQYIPAPRDYGAIEYAAQEIYTTFPEYHFTYTPNENRGFSMDDIREEAQSRITDSMRQFISEHALEIYEDYASRLAPQPVAPSVFDDFTPFYIDEKNGNKEIYGFITPKGEMYLDETVISPEHPLHEYTHLWDRVVAKKNPRFWKTGISLFKRAWFTDENNNRVNLWNWVANNSEYGLKWKQLVKEGKLEEEKVEGLIASEVHARLVGKRGMETLAKIVKDKGSEGIIEKLKQWLVDFWRQLKSAFMLENWDEGEEGNKKLKKFEEWAEKDVDKALEYLSDITVYDFATGVNPLNPNKNQQGQTTNQQKTNIIQKYNGFWTRNSVENDPTTLYIFTDNTDRDSGGGFISADSWYSKKYGQGHHYPTQTTAVIRGLNNAFPISTVKWFYKNHSGVTHPKYDRNSKALWHDSDFDEFKRTVDDEFEELKKAWDSGKYKRVVFPGGDGLFNAEISDISEKRVPQIYKYLQTKYQDFVNYVQQSQAVSPQTNTTSNLPGPETKMEIWWGSGESDPNRQNADLSNFAERPFTIKGSDLGFINSNTTYTFPTVEHAFQTAKIVYSDAPSEVKNEWFKKIRNAKTSSEAKQLGGNIPQLDQTDWNLNSSEIMKDLIMESFKQNPQALQRLLATGNATLTHNNAKGKWKTEFPRILMEVRDELRENQPVNSIPQSPTPQKPSQPSVEFSKSGGWYPQRTKENAEWSDITLALAADFTTPGEIATKKAAGSKYHSMALPIKGKLEDSHNFITGGQVDGQRWLKTQKIKEKFSGVLKLNIAGNSIDTLTSKGYTQDEVNDYLQGFLFAILQEGIKLEVRSGGQTGIDEAGIVAAQRLGIKATVHAPNDWSFRPADGKDVRNDEQAFKARFQQSAQNTQQPSVAPQPEAVPPAPKQDWRSVVDAWKSGQANNPDMFTPEKTYERPQSTAFESEITPKSNRTADFYRTFNPQQIRDRGAMIARDFSMILQSMKKEYIEKYESEIEVNEAVLQDKGLKIGEIVSLEQEIEDYKCRIAEYKDPVKGNQNFLKSVQVSDVLDAIKKKYSESIDYYESQQDDNLKYIAQQLRNTLEYFTELFNAQASIDIERRENIKIVNLEVNKKTDEENDADENHDGNDETGHVSGNEGWLYQARFEDPSNSLAGAVRRMLSGIRRPDEEVDDIGERRCYNSGQVYASLLAFLSKRLENPNDFVRIRRNGKDLDGYEVNDTDWPHGYPEFPALEDMKKKYPWVQQVITRLTYDYYSGQDNPNLVEDEMPATYGSMASQFYTCFFQAFIPYCRINIEKDGTRKLIPLNYSLEDKVLFDRFTSNVKNGFLLTSDSVYTANGRVNRENAKKLLPHASNAFRDVSSMVKIQAKFGDVNGNISELETKMYNAFLEEVSGLFKSLGFDVSEESVAYFLSAEDNGKFLQDKLSIVEQILKKLSELKDEKLDTYDYVLDTKTPANAYFFRILSNNLGTVTDVSYMQSFYDSASKKTRYSYSADNYMQTVFRAISIDDKAKRQAYMDEKFKKYEWYYNHKTNQWRNKWLEKIYKYGNKLAGNLPYLNVNNVTHMTDLGPRVKEYTKWDPEDIYEVQRAGYNRFDKGDDAYFLSPIFADSPMSMLIGGPVLSMKELLDGYDDKEEGVHRQGAFIDLIDQELWRIKYVSKERAEAIENGQVNEISNFDKRGREFCFFPQLNDYRFPDGTKFLDKMIELSDDEAGADEIRKFEIAAMREILEQQFMEFIRDDKENVFGKWEDLSDDSKEELRKMYYNMAYATASIIQITGVDLAYYKNLEDFQKRFKQVYAAGKHLNTNSKYGKKTEKVGLITDDIITSPSYDKIAAEIDSHDALSEEDKKRIKKLYREINVADGQALRAMHSYRSILDMMGKWDDRMEKAIQNFKDGNWTREDFDIVFQTLKPFVYSVIERNGGDGNVIPVPVQHKNSEICLLMMWNLISNDLKESPVYQGIADFLETKDENGEYYIDMLQYESGGKVGNCGTVNLSYYPERVIGALNDEIEALKVLGYNLKGEAKSYLDRKYWNRDKDDKAKKAYNKAIKALEENDKNSAEKNYYTLKDTFSTMLDEKRIKQEDFDTIMRELRPKTKEEVKEILEARYFITDENGKRALNTEFIQEIPFDDYQQAQPTPPHHVDSEATFGSQGRNIAPADLPEDIEITLEGMDSKSTKTKKIKDKKTGKTIDIPDRKATRVIKGKDAVVDFYYELLNEDLIEDYFGSSYRKNAEGLKDKFKDKESFKKEIERIVRGNSKYGNDFADAMQLDEEGNFVLSPNSPTMFRIMQEIVTSFFKNKITKQKVNGASLIQAAGIGLDEKLRLEFDENGKPVAAHCYMPLTSKRFFEPFLRTKKVNGKIVKYLDAQALKDAGLEKAIGYRIPTENTSSMLPLIIDGFTPLQNGSVIVLPAEITTLSGSDFDVDKMFLILSSFKVINYKYSQASRDYKAQKEKTEKFIEEYELDPDLVDNPDFDTWFEENKDNYVLRKPIIKKVEYDFSKTPKQNGRQARGNLILQMMYQMLSSKKNYGSILNPQGFPNAEKAAKVNKILSTPKLLRAAMVQLNSMSNNAVIPSPEDIKKMFMDGIRQRYQDKNVVSKWEEKVNKMSREQLQEAYIQSISADEDKLEAFEKMLMQSTLDELKDFIKNNSEVESPVFPQAFQKAHARNMAGSNQIGIYAIQGSMTAKYQRASIRLRKDKWMNMQFTIVEERYDENTGKKIQTTNNVTAVDRSHNGAELKAVGEMIGASADNGKNPVLIDFGSTSETAPIIGYMLRCGIKHLETSLIINQPIFFMSEYDIADYYGFDVTKEAMNDVTVTTKDLLMGKLNFDRLSIDKQKAIAALCWKIRKQAEAMEDITAVSRADSPNGAMGNTFAKARIQQYKVDLLRGKMDRNDFPFMYISETLSNTAVDPSADEETIREQLKKQPMGLLHGMYALGINSLNANASKMFFMLTKRFDDHFVKPILYNMGEKVSDDKKEEIVQKLYEQYVVFCLSKSELFGDEFNAAKNNSVTFDEKRNYYLNSFADDYTRILRENEDIKDLIGSILVRDGNRIVLSDVTSLGKEYTADIMRRLNMLLYSDNEEARKLAGDLLMYSYYDSGIGFTPNSFSEMFSTQFLTHFKAYTDTVNHLSDRLADTEDESAVFEERFLQQFLANNPSAAYYVKEIPEVKEIRGMLLFQMSESKIRNKVVNTALTQNRQGEGYKLHKYISYNDDIYVLDEELYESQPQTAVYRKLPVYKTDGHPLYDYNRSVDEMAAAYGIVEKNKEDNSYDELYDTQFAIDDTPSLFTTESDSELYKREGNQALQDEMCNG